MLTFDLDHKIIYVVGLFFMGIVGVSNLFQRTMTVYFDHGLYGEVQGTLILVLLVYMVWNDSAFLRKKKVPKQ